MYKYFTFGISRDGPRHRPRKMRRECEINFGNDHSDKREREREREREDAIGNVRCENDARVRESGREVAIFGSHRWDERSIRPAAEKDETNDAGAPPRSP